MLGSTTFHPTYKKNGEGIVGKTGFLSAIALCGEIAIASYLKTEFPCHQISTKLETGGIKNIKFT